jgi:two-component system cell cycle response regulator
MKILVADDDAVSRCLMERILRRVGYEVVLAEDGRQALKTLMSPDRPRLALLDWMMPGLDGPAVCLEVRSHREQPYSYIILLTSKEAKEDLIAGLRAGADDYLTKPCNAEELKARLRTGERILRLEDTLVQAREEMRFRATHDALTSLWNRGAILNRLNEEIDRVRREQARCSLLLCDVDNFKRINDVHGHLTGDAVLRDVAIHLTRATRRGDAVGRYGGEEFLVILSDCGAESVANRAEELRQAVASEVLTATLRGLSISISIGAIAIDHSSRQIVEDYLSQADSALYRAKMEGRNRVVIADQTNTNDKCACNQPKIHENACPWVGDDISSGL